MMQSILKDRSIDPKSVNQTNLVLPYIIFNSWNKSKWDIKERFCSKSSIANTFLPKKMLFIIDLYIYQRLYCLSSVTE